MEGRPHDSAIGGLAPVEGWPHDSVMVEVEVLWMLRWSEAEMRATNTTCMFEALGRRPVVQRREGVAEVGREEVAAGGRPLPPLQDRANKGW